MKLTRKRAGVLLAAAGIVATTCAGVSDAQAATTARTVTATKAAAVKAVAVKTATLAPPSWRVTPKGYGKDRLVTDMR